MENNNKPKQPNKPPKQEKEELTHQEWLEIMNVNRDTYKRVNGRIRRRG